MYFHESVNRFSMAFTTLTTVPVYEEKKCLEKPRKRQHETAPKKYPRILRQVSLLRFFRRACHLEGVETEGLVGWAYSRCRCVDFQRTTSVTSVLVF